MKSILPVFFLGLFATLPFVFNSCQGGFHSQSSLGSSLSAASCKVTLQEGQVRKLTHSYLEQPKEFVESKLKLNSVSGTHSGLQKTNGGSLVSEGSSLSAIYNNSCLREQNHDKTVRLWSLISPENEVEPLKDLIFQAYTIDLERDYETSELQDLVDADPCVVGVSWNESYLAQSVFNDSESYKQGHLASIKAMQAYDQAYGADLSQATSITSSVKVAVIDSGVDWQHPDLQGHFWAHSQGWGIDATTIDSNLVNYNPFDVSSNGHGTHIAGLIGAVSNNSLGVIGTLPFNAKIMAVKIFKMNSSNQMVTSTTYLYNGLQFAMLNGAEVLNLSLMATGSSYDAVLSSAIDDALSQGITVVGAMGNGSPGSLVDGSSLKVVPAIYSTRSGMMSVGSFDSSTDLKSDFSHYSSTYAEISAPGAEQGTSQGLYSTLPLSLGGYGRLAGTSQSTAIVSGAAALSIAMIKRAYGMAPSPTEVERLILDSARKNANLASYFKDGNQLDLSSLVSKIHSDYPETKNLGTANPVNCP